MKIQELIKQGLILLFCYMTISMTTMVDAFYAGTSSFIADRIMAQPMTMIAAPLLIFLAINMFNRLSQKTEAAE